MALAFGTVSTAWAQAGGAGGGAGGAGGGAAGAGAGARVQAEQVQAQVTGMSNPSVPRWRGWRLYRHQPDAQQCSERYQPEW